MKAETLVIGLLVFEVTDAEELAWVVFPDGQRSPVIVDDVGAHHPIKRLLAEHRWRHAPGPARDSPS